MKKNRQMNTVNSANEPEKQRTEDRIGSLAAKGPGSDDRTIIKKRDWILAAVILAAAGCLMLGMLLTRQKTGNTVEIRVDGRIYRSCPLNQDDCFTVETEYGHNIVEIKNGSVSVTEADCEGHDCIRQGKISRCNETIICLPHKLVIEITLHGAEDQQETDFDIVAK